jgi:hypothetical protein
VQGYLPYEVRDVTPEELEEERRKTHEVFAELSHEDWEEIKQAWKRIP